MQPANQTTKHFFSTTLIRRDNHQFTFYNTRENICLSGLVKL